MLSHGICIMSMVHRQRAVLLQFPLVIYLAALLKCSCRWHWLTNQTVKPHPEYQRKYCFKISVLPSAFWTMSCTNQVAAIDFFLWCTSPGFFLKGTKPKSKATALDRTAGCSLLSSCTAKLTSHQKAPPYINLPLVLISEVVSVSV